MDKGERKSLQTFLEKRLTKEEIAELKREAQISIGLMHGEISIGDDIVTFVGKTQAELVEELIKSMNEYNEWKEEQGVE